MNPVRDEVTENLDMQELPVVKKWLVPPDFRKDSAARGRDVTPSKF